MARCPYTYRLYNHIVRDERHTDCTILRYGRIVEALAHAERRAA